MRRGFGWRIGRAEHRLQRAMLDRGGLGEEATRLWAEYCAGSNPHTVEALDRLHRKLRRPLVECCRVKGYLEPCD